MVISDIEGESFRYMILKYLDAISGLVALIIYTNILSVTDVGLYFTGLAVYTIGSSAARGLYDAVRKRGSEDGVDISIYYSMALLGSGVYTLLVMIATAVGYIILTNGYLFIQYNIPVILLYGVIIRLMGNALFQSFEATYAGKGKVAVGGFYNLINGIMETIFQIGLLVLIGPNILYLFIGSAMSATIISAIMWFNLQDVRFKRFTLDDVWSVRDFGFWNSLSSFSEDIEHRLITIILSSTVGPAVAGVYGAVVRTTTPAFYVSYSLSQTLFIETSFRDSRAESISEKLPMALKYATVIAIPMLFGSIGLSEEVLSILYSQEFSNGGLILISMSAAVVLQSEANIFNGYLHGLDSAKTVAKGSLINLITSLSVLAVGVYFIGINILLISLVLSRILYLIYLYVSVKKVCSFDFDWGVLYQFVSGGVMLLLIYGQKQVFQIDSYLVFVVVGFDAAVYFGILLLLDREFYERISRKFMEFRS